jgi:hypothetical protein
MPGFPKARPPANRKVLETWISQKAREDGVAVNRLRRGISFMVISAVLARMVDDEGLPLFLLKGGVAMELRVGLEARASKDYDTAFRQTIERVTDVLAEAETHVHGDFRVIVGRAVPIGPTGAVRIPLKLAYGAHDWGSVDLEVAAAEGGSGARDTIEYAEGSPALSVFGLPDVDRVALLPLPYQIAQKIHACTEPRDGKDNDRFRDLVDLILLDGLVVGADLRRVRDACLEVFSLRGTHAWPPSVKIYPLWPDQYRALTESMRFPVTDVTEAAAAVEAMVAKISKAAAGA